MDYRNFIFLTIGVITTTRITQNILSFIHIYTRSSSLPRYLNSNSPTWALVTGASDGIGLAISHELAHRGFNVVLHGRNISKLEQRRQELQAAHPTREFRVVVADASISGPGMLTQIENMARDVAGLNLGVLINNVGGGPAIQEGEAVFATLDKSRPVTNEAWVSLNARFPTHLTAALIPILEKNSPSLIINISSLADEGTPWITMYSGAKAMLMGWSKGLAREMEAVGRDIEVLGVETGQVTGVGWKDKKATLMEPDARTFARAVLDRVGCGRLVVCGYWGHGVLTALTGCLPEWLYRKVLVDAMRREMGSVDKVLKTD